MQTREMVTLVRDCPAILIPAGDPITLKKGQEVMITQNLGGSYTVIVLGNMALIDGQDADAIGREVAAKAKNGEPQTILAEKPVDEGLIWDQLKACYDPEIPVNIVDLGLVYDMQLTPVANGTGNRVEIKMTLTAPGCGMGATIAEDVKQKALSVPGVVEASVELVWEPMWNQSMMSEAAQLQLGFL